MNKITSKLKKDNENQNEKMNINELLEDSPDSQIIKQSQINQNYICLSPDSFEPDPKQPRKIFNQQEIAALQKSVEDNGQLQPLLVGKKQENGKYPIILGERRWRAISQSKSVDTIVAIVIDKESNPDELRTLVMQIHENAVRTDITIAEKVQAIQNVVDLCNKDRSLASNVLNISSSLLSKHLALNKAPDPIKLLSIENDIQDLETLYELNLLYKKDPDKTSIFIDKIKDGTVTDNLRATIRNLNSKSNNSKSENEPGDESNNQSVNDENEPAVPIRFSSIEPDKEQKNAFVFTITLKQHAPKPMVSVLTSATKEQLESLRNEINNVI